MTLTLERLLEAVQKDAAIRRRRRLQPTGGHGDKIFPPTYPGAGKTDPPRHVFEHRRVGGENVLCVLVDSVQSQANRLEEALRIAREENAITFPAISVDFTGTAVADIGHITTLDAPHRVFDAIVRDSELEGKVFRETTFGRKLIEAKPSSASSVYELSPTALVFGAWNSTGDGGGLGAKFPRALVSEIVGVNVATEIEDWQSGKTRASGQRAGSRIDPLGIRSGVKVLKAPDGTWSLPPQGEPKKDAPKAKEKDKDNGKDKKKEPKEVRPSEVNHSNIAPSLQPLGVSVDHVEHTFVLSLAALRRLRFVVKGEAKPDLQVAARATLAALGLAAGVAQDRAGYFLRSRCDLVPEEGTADGFEIVHADGTRESFALSFEEACALAASGAARAAKLGLPWREEDVVLKPQAKLVELVVRSRNQALQGVAESDE